MIKTILGKFSFVFSRYVLKLLHPSLLKRLFLLSISLIISFNTIFPYSTSISFAINFPCGNTGSEYLENSTPSLKSNKYRFTSSGLYRVQRLKIKL